MSDKSFDNEDEFDKETKDKEEMHEVWEDGQGECQRDVCMLADSQE